MRPLCLSLLLLCFACSDEPTGSDAGRADGGGGTDAATADAALSDAGSMDGALPTDVILDLDIGNQITRSYLTVRDDGTVTRDEQTCCPPTRAPATAEPLDAAVLAQLRADAMAVAGMGTTRTDLGKFPKGAQAGYLRVQVMGTSHVVRQYVPEGGRRVRIASDATTAADSIVSLVNTMVDVDVE